MLSEIGMEVYAERARRELLATGETVRKRTVETIDDLTPQELQIAQRAADGQTNPEIGAQLFLSPRTVEWHLRKVFGKLGISSRKELRSALPGRCRDRPDRMKRVPPPAGPSPFLSGAGGAGSRAVRASRGSRPHRETTTSNASFMYASAALSACAGVSPSWRAAK